MRAEEALRESQERLAGIVGAAMDAIISVDEHQQVVLFNAAAEKMFGCAAPNVLGKPLASLIPERYRTAHEEHIKRFGAAGVTTRQMGALGEIYGLRACGEEFPIEASISQGTTSGGKLFTVILRDITERKQAEAALQESEEVFRAIFDQSMVGKVQADLATGRFLRVNPAFCQFTGYSEKELLERTFFEITHPDNRAGDVAKLQALRENRTKSFESEKRYVRPDGGFVWGHVSVNLVHDAAGRGKFAVAVVQDITASKEAKEKLAQLTELLSESQKIAHLGSFEYVADTRTTIWSEEEYRIYGLDPTGPSPNYEVMLAKSIHPEDATLLHETFAEAMCKGGIYELEHRIVRPEGSVRWVYDRAHPCFDEQGKLLRYVGATLDITERKQAEEALQAALREKDVLLHEVHHRVKNNLQVISSLVSLQAGSITGPEREVFGNIQDQVRAMSLVHEMLYQAGDFSRIQFAEYARNLLGQLWRAHGEVAARANLGLDLQPVTMPLTMAVPCGLILNELAGNALKHAFRGRPTGGQVTVSLTGEPEGRVCLRVADNGVGLPEGLDWRNAPSLGLRLVQMLARQVGGTVESRCPNGGGVEFEVQFVAKDDLTLEQ